MAPSPLIVLFLSTGNSARSILAEALLNHKKSDRFVAKSAGFEPIFDVATETVSLLKAQSINTDMLRSKSWNEFCSLPDSMKPDVVVTLSEEAKENCPCWLNNIVKIHWAVDNPLSSDRVDVREWKFRKCFSTLEARINTLVRSRPAANPGALFMQFKDLSMVV